MSLLSIDNRASTLHMYLPLLKSLDFPHFCKLQLKYMTILESSYWTSASSEGLFCASEQTFAWCSSGTVVAETFVNDTALWTEIPTGKETLANCVTLGLDKNESSARLSLAACSESKSLMCQVYKINDKVSTVAATDLKLLTAKV
jgi:hypothetical protein